MNIKGPVAMEWFQQIFHIKGPVYLESFQQIFHIKGPVYLECLQQIFHIKGPLYLECFQQIFHKGQFTWNVFSRFSLFSHASSMIFPLAPCRKPTSDLGVLLRQKKAVIHSKFTSFCICFRRIFCKVNVPD